MTYPKAIVLAAAFITGAIIYVNQPAQSTDGLTVHARYLIGGVAEDGFGAWAIDTWTGAVNFCGVAATTPKPVRQCVVIQKQWPHD